MRGDSLLCGAMLAGIDPADMNSPATKPLSRLSWGLLVTLRVRPGHEEECAGMCSPLNHGKKTAETTMKVMLQLKQE
jgi:hypothetical protein